MFAASRVSVSTDQETDGGATADLAIGAVYDGGRASVTLVTHRLGDEPRAAVPPGLGVIESGRRVDWFAHHYADAALEYALGRS